MGGLPREFQIQVIEFYKPGWFNYFLRRADHLFILPDRDKTEMVWVDMVLTQTNHYKLNDFCGYLKTVALDHPAWWKRHSSRTQIESMFSNCKTFSKAINDIGVLDSAKRGKLNGKSKKIIDFR